MSIRTSLLMIAEVLKPAYFYLVETPGYLPRHSKEQYQIIDVLNKQIAILRRDFQKASLDETAIAEHPVKQFEKWWQEAARMELEDMNAMVLSTCTPDGWPSARIVLLKSFDMDGFIFFTNYNSRKGREIAFNAKVSLLFFWKELEQQIRIDGIAEETSESVSDEYFQMRPKESRISAIASPQSHRIPSRNFLEEHVNNIAEKYATKEPVRPAYWGGYVVKPVLMEFWQGRSNRLHDRIQYTLTLDSTWKIERLAP